MKGGPKEQVVTNQLDPATQAYRNEIFNRARGVSNQPYTGYNGQTVAGPDQASLGALSGIQGMGGIYRGISGAFGNVPGGISGPNIGPYSQAGSVAARALGGDSDAVSSLMNPYQQNVIDALGTQYDRQRDKALMQTNDQATQSGAFGGDRAALLAGERLGALDRGQESDVANLLNSGFQSTMDRAAGTAGLGLNAQNMASQFGLGLGNLRLGAAQGQLGAAQGQQSAYGDAFGMGDYLHGINQQKLDAAQNKFNEQRDWGLRGLNILQSGLSGMPYGTSQSQPLYQNRGAGLLGGAATGAQIGSMIPGLGTGIGAGIGGLIGLFG